MADLIQIKGGSGDVPPLKDRELAIKKNGKQSELYCGVNGENIRLCGANDKATGEEALDAKVNELQAEINALNSTIDNITARLVALEKPSE